MKRKLLLTAAIVLSFFVFSNAQEDTETENEQSQNFYLSADIVTNYIWRGLVFSDKPNIQPYLAYTNNKGNFSFGGWGSYSLADYYSEVDLFVSYSVGNLTFAIWDYFLMTQDINNKYFNYDKDSTYHAFEAMITFNGPESFPLELIASTFFYGIDKDANGDNYYSTYLEVGYPFKWKANNLKVYFGMTPQEGLYASDLAVVNIGMKNTREIKITDKFSMPISGSIIVNPNTENIFFVLTLTIAAND